MKKKRVAVVQGNRQKERKLTLKRHRGSVLIVSGVVLLLIVVVLAGSAGLRRQNDMYKRQEAELQQQIDEEKEREKEIEEYEEYIKTDDYIKDVAEDKLNLTDSNEIVFKPTD